MRLSDVRRPCFSLLRRNVRLEKVAPDLVSQGDSRPFVGHEEDENPTPVSVSGSRFVIRPAKSGFRCFRKGTTRQVPNHSVSSSSLKTDLGGDDPIILSCVVNDSINTVCMLDSGATSQFIDQEWAISQGLVLKKKKHPECLTVVDGRPSVAGDITHEVTIKVLIDQHSENLTCRVTRLGDHKLILGKSWLRLHNPVIDWQRNTVLFGSGFCQAHCLPLRQTPAPSFSVPSQNNNRFSISMVSATCFLATARQKSTELFAVSVRDIQKALDIKKKTASEELADMRKTIPSDYHEYIDLFLKEVADAKLPPHRYIDHEIPLEEGTKPPFGPLYSMSELELKALREYLEENLSKGFIRASSSSAASPVLFAKKADGSLRFCVDYRALNKITKKNRYPLPLIDETLNRIRSAKVFTRLDLRAAFNLIRIKEGDEWKTAFRTRYGLFEYLVMPFGLTNAPATCQQFVNDTLREYLDVFCCVYLDDILIYSDDLEKHTKHVKMILNKLQEAGLYVKGEKCEFHTTSTTFLGFIISPTGISMDPAKVKAVQEWETPQSVHDVQCFLGFANFYRRFINGYARICNPLFNLLRKDTVWSWTPECEKAFAFLRESFCSAPILRHYKPELDTVLEVDASDSVTGGILSQYASDDNNNLVLHPIAFRSKKMSPAECNYGIGDKELLAIVQAFEDWHLYLEGTSSPVTVYTDHSNLQTFMDKMRLSRRQARWAQKLAEYNFVIVYREGKANGKADALSRRSGDLPKEGDGRGRPIDSILKPQNFLSFAATTNFHAEVSKSLATDTLGQSVIKALNSGDSRHPKVALAECSYSNGLLLVNGLLYIPDDESLQAKIIRSCHEHPAAGHPGRAATFELLTREYWWPSMRRTIARYIRNCDTCSRIKPARHAPYGFLSPLTVPQRRWESCSMDFIVGLPVSDGKDALFVVVDRLTKMAHFIPCTSEIDSPEAARLFADHVFKHHGLPATIVADRGPQFRSQFLKSLCNILAISQNLSSGFHPQTDGQTERINAILEQYLRAYCNYQQDNWVELLTLAEFSYNNTVSSTTGVTPFFANYGQAPRWQILARQDVPLPTNEKLLDFSDRLQKLETHLRAEMKYAQDEQAEYADRHRLAPPAFKVGDQVWLLRRHIRTNRPSNKLDYKRLGKFEIMAKISPHAYKLKLPHSMKVHPVFHISLLEPVATDPLPGQVQPPPPPIEVDGQLEYEVDSILDSRRHRRRLEYLVQWSGDFVPTWQPHWDLQNSPRLVRDFHLQYPQKPRPSKLPDLPN